MKHFVFLFIVPAIITFFIANSGFAQVKLNGPQHQDSEQVNEDFESFEDELTFEDAELTQNKNPAGNPEFIPTDDSELRVVGQNKNGETEFSVLENRMDLDHSPNQLHSLNRMPIEYQESDPNLEPTNSLDSNIVNHSEHFQVTPEINQFITGLVLKHLPHEFVQDKKWGKQTKRWAGVKFRRDDDDGKLETKRNFKMVNHGTWQKYSAELIDPEQKFSVALNDVSKTKNGDTQCDVGFAANLKIDARQSKWVKGVQLYSFSAEGTAKVRLAILCEFGVDLDLSQFPPELVFAPKVTDAKIVVDEFKLRRVSKAGGEFAQQVSRVARKELDSKIQEKEKKLVKKLNQEINENPEKLRLSVAQAIQSKWFRQAQQHLPNDIQNAMSTAAVSPALDGPNSLPNHGTMVPTLNRNAATNEKFPR